MPFATGFRSKVTKCTLAASGGMPTKTLGLADSQRVFLGGWSRGVGGCGGAPLVRHRHPRCRPAGETLQPSPPRPPPTSGSEGQEGLFGSAKLLAALASTPSRSASVIFCSPRDVETRGSSRVDSGEELMGEEALWQRSSDSRVEQNRCFYRFQFRLLSTPRGRKKTTRRGGMRCLS